MVEFTKPDSMAYARELTEAAERLNKLLSAGSSYGYKVSVEVLSIQYLPFITIRAIPK